MSWHDVAVGKSPWGDFPTATSARATTRSSNVNLITFLINYHHHVDKKVPRLSSLMPHLPVPSLHCAGCGDFFGVRLTHMQKYQILLATYGMFRESAKQHRQTHSCTKSFRCTKGDSSRRMEHDDWIKFGHVVWAAHDGKIKGQALESYKKAWRKIYHSEPRLDASAPANFLDDNKYNCAKPVPWRPQVEARFATPLLTSASSSSSGPAAPPPAPIPKPAPAPAPAPSSIASRDADEADDNLIRSLKSANAELVFDTSFPRIRGGFFPGFQRYIETRKTVPLRAVFIIIPQYLVAIKDEKPTSDISAIELDEEDYQAINTEEPRCLYQSTDQSKCAPGKIRYFCSSWVLLFVR